jgi:hypothetical protein
MKLAVSHVARPRPLPVLALLALALAPLVAAEICPDAVKNPRAVMSGVVGNGKCNVCVAKSSFWFYKHYLSSFFCLP